MQWNGKLSYVHRVVYQLAVGPIPEGCVIAHLRTRGCVYNHCCNPGHLEGVTPAESTAHIDWAGRQGSPEALSERPRVHAGEHIHRPFAWLPAMPRVSAGQGSAEPFAEVS